MIQQPTEVTIKARVDYSSGRYRIWDDKCMIPKPSEGCYDVAIFLNGDWEKMHFNTVWGKKLDFKNNEGTWLKQKSETTFQHDANEFKVRYYITRG